MKTLIEKMLTVIDELRSNAFTLDEFVYYYEITYHIWIQPEHRSIFQRKFKEMGIKFENGVYHLN